MATAIYTGSASPGAAATGRPNQGHVQYAVNSGLWWVFYLTSTQTLSAAYSANGTSWTPVTGYTLTLPHASEGRNFGFAYANISSIDVLQVESAYDVASGGSFETRFTLGTSSWTNTNAEVTTAAVNNPGAGGTPNGGMPAFSSAGKVYCAGSYVNGLVSGGNITSWGTDSGSSWTPGSPASQQVDGSGSFTNSFGLIPLASGNMLFVSDDGGSSDTFTNLDSFYYNGSSWSSLVNVFGSAVTAADTNAWGIAKISNTAVHLAALSNNSNAFTHWTNAGATSAWSAGNTIPGSGSALTYGTNSGVALVSNGTNVYAFAFDTSGNLKYCKWTASGTSWGAWTTQESGRTNTPAYVTACYSSAVNAIQVIWTEKNGSNYEVWTSQLSLAAGPTGLPPSPSLIFPSMYFPSMIEE